MKESNYYKYASIAGITSSVLFLISIIGMQYYLAASLEDVLSFTHNMNESHNMMLMYGWPGLMATILIIPLIDVFYRENHLTQQFSRIIFLIVIIGLSFVLVGYLFHLALTYFYAPLHHSMEEEYRESFGYIIKATIGLQDMFWLYGDLLAFFGIALLLMFNIKERLFSKWILGLGMLSGLMAAVGSLAFIPAYKGVPGLNLLFIGGFSLFVIWEIVISVSLWRKSAIRNVTMRGLLVTRDGA